MSGPDLARAEKELRDARKALAKGQSELLALQRRLARAERLSALGALAARLAHELGTPLHSVAGHLDLMLADEGLPAGSRARAEIIAGEVDRLSAMIRSHLRRLRAPSPKPRPTSINELLAGILGLMEPLLGFRSIDVTTDLAPEANAPLDCDPGQVEQVVLNLIQNALDAMPDEGGAMIVRSAVTAGGRAISVSDNGRGVAPKHIGRVFEPFFTTKGANQGTGLGLALSREIARQHGGDIVLDSQPGVGTVVTFTLGALGAIGERG